MSKTEPVRERDRRALLLAALADVTPRTAARFLSGEREMQRKTREALESAHRIAREKHPEIIGGGA